MKYATCLTPPGRSAIATIQASGFQDLGEIDAFFRPANSVSIRDSADGRITFGCWSNRGGSSEELVVARVSTNEIRIHCHGGNAAKDAILDSLKAIGFQLLLPTTRTVDTEISLAEEISRGLLNASTKKIANFFLCLTPDIYQTEITKALGLISTQPDAAMAKLRSIRDTFAVGKFLSRPIRIVLAGPANVGKSSINNRILGYDRSITFDSPGTTRDVVSELTTIDGWSFEFSDTAGIRTSHDALESAGMEQARHQMALADVVIWVQSGESLIQSEKESRTDKEESDFCVINKSDLLNRDQQEFLLERYPDSLLVNAKYGQGIDRLLDLIKLRAIPNEPELGSIVLFTERQAKMIDHSLLDLSSGNTNSAQRWLQKLITA